MYVVFRLSLTSVSSVWCSKGPGSYPHQPNQPRDLLGCSCSDSQILPDHLRWNRWGQAALEVADQQVEPEAIRKPQQIAETVWLQQTKTPLFEIFVACLKKIVEYKVYLCRRANYLHLPPAKRSIWSTPVILEVVLCAYLICHWVGLKKTDAKFTEINIFFSST